MLISACIVIDIPVAEMILPQTVAHSYPAQLLSFCRR